MYDHGVCAHNGVVSDENSAQDFAAGTKRNVVTDLGTLAGIEVHVELPCAERNTLKDCHIAAQAARADDSANRMRKEDAGADVAVGRDFEAKEEEIQA
jgi:hypothetical protein